MKVMLIEDEPNAMERYCSYIAAYNPAFEIVAKASTYEMAKEMFASQTIDVLFSDVMIPGRSGLHFLEEVRSEHWRGLVVIISGYGDFSYAQKAIKLSVFDYLLKPVFQKDLEQSLGQDPENHEPERTSDSLLFQYMSSPLYQESHSVC